MADTDKMYGELSESKLDEITEKIEMKWNESLFGILTILNELSFEERKAFLNIVGKSLGKEIRIPQDVNVIIRFSADYLSSRGIDISKNSGLQVYDSNVLDQGMYDRITAIGENYKHGGR